MTERTASPVYTDNPSRGRTVRPLRIVIPGGAGHLGRLLTRHFLAGEHSVTVLTRHCPAASADSGGPAGSGNVARLVPWDGKSKGEWAAALENADVVINLAGRTVNCRYNAKNRRQILCSRVESTTVLGQAIQTLRHPPRVWLNASTATIYRQSFDREMDEATGELGGNEPNAPPTWRFSIEVARAWEQSFFSCETPKTRKIAMRAAMVMSSEPGGAFEPIVRLVRMGLGGAWGSGAQYMSWIHETDFSGAVDFLMDRDEIEGIVNVAAPCPLRNDEFMSAVRSAWESKLGLPAPEWMLESAALLVRTETELLLKSRRVIPVVLKQNGFRFSFPTWPEAAADLVAHWKNKGVSR